MASTGSRQATAGSLISEFAAAAEALRAQGPRSNPRLRQAEATLRENRLAEAREQLTHFLERHPYEPVALNLMAATVSRLGRKEEAEALLAQCVALDPSFAAARYEYASILFQLNKTGEALAQIEQLLAVQPRNVLFRDLKSVVLASRGEHAAALDCYSAMAEDFPSSPEIWVKYGAALRSIGLREESVAAYRKAIELRPNFGEAYWRLAGLRNYCFSDSDIARMQTQLARPDLASQERIYFHFALGSALGTRADYGKSFENYVRGNALKRLSIDYDPNSLQKHVHACKALMTPEFFRAREGSGCDRTGPIFVVGLQRSGSTLIEQILANHSAVEATAELPDISLLAEHIGEKIASPRGMSYPEVLAELDDAALKSLGERYLQSTEYRRRLRRPLFTDKMPYNFLHLGLIFLILPNARIIDARRHPLACCFSNFSMHFNSGPLFGHRLSELGKAYAGYAELMAHFDRVLPGRILRVFYEDLVRSPEKEIRRLLDYVGLPFEDGCVEFHRSNRPMDSASSEQVRRPLYEDALDYWRNYEPWLTPLKSSLGSVLEAYPDVPELWK